MYDVNELRRNAQSRRLFLKRMTAAGIGAAAFAVMELPGKSRSAFAAAPSAPAGPPADQSAFPGIPGKTNDTIVLNYALTLERLEADLYRQALNRASGLPIGTPLNADPTVYNLGAGVSAGTLSAGDAKDAFKYIKQFTYAESAHRDLLYTAISALGDTPVLPNPTGYRFPTAIPKSLPGILALLLPLEETGVRAYLGAVPYLEDYKSIGTVAAGIFSVEARHSAAIAENLGMDPGPRKMPGDLTVIPTYPSENTLEYYLAPATVIDRVKAYFA